MVDLKYIMMRFNINTEDLNRYRDKSTEKPIYIPRQYNNQSRYTTVRRVKDNSTNILYHENWTKKLIDSSSSDQYFKVTLREENRLDIIANDFYSTPRYWWVIAIGNEIIDPFDVPIGSFLRIPDINSLYNNGGLLNGSGI